MSLDPLDQQRIVAFGYGERRIRGTASLLAPGQPVGGEGKAFLRSMRLTPLRYGFWQRLTRPRDDLD